MTVLLRSTQLATLYCLVFLCCRPCGQAGRTSNLPFAAYSAEVGPFFPLPGLPTLPCAGPEQLGVIEIDEIDPAPKPFSRGRGPETHFAAFPFLPQSPLLLSSLTVCRDREVKVSLAHRCTQAHSFFVSFSEEASVARRRKGTRASVLRPHGASQSPSSSGAV